MRSITNDLTIDLNTSKIWTYLRRVSTLEYLIRIVCSFENSRSNCLVEILHLWANDSINYWAASTPEYGLDTRNPKIQAITF